MNNTALLLRLPLLALLVDVLHVNYLVGNVSVLVVLFLARFVVSDRLIFREGMPVKTFRKGRRVGASPVDQVVDLTESAPSPGGADPVRRDRVTEGGGW